MPFKVITSGPVPANPMATKLCLLLLFEVIRILHNRITVTGNRNPNSIEETGGGKHVLRNGMSQGKVGV
jgi:hypothetical protein